MNRQDNCEERVRELYGASVPEAMPVVEREVIGANVGANGYTYSVLSVLENVAAHDREHAEQIKKTVAA